MMDHSPLIYTFGHHLGFFNSTGSSPSHPEELMQNQSMDFLALISFFVSLYFGFAFLLFPFGIS